MQGLHPAAGAFQRAFGELVRIGELVADYKIRLQPQSCSLRRGIQLDHEAVVKGYRISLVIYTSVIKGEVHPRVDFRLEFGRGFIAPALIVSYEGNGNTWEVKSVNMSEGNPKSVQWIKALLPHSISPTPTTANAAMHYGCQTFAGRRLAKALRKRP